MPDNTQRLQQFMDLVWNMGDVSLVPTFVAEQYTVHSDPGDPWEGQTLSREGFAERMQISRAPFPDLRFEVTDTVAEGDRVAISWIMRGTHLAAMGAVPATGRAIAVQGMTIYTFADGYLTGHRQVVDRLAVAAQLGLMGR
jgi:steroid delta-isomerase-like uncharacterized protein